ncbi:FkbM family methyltransferase [Fischerella sp. PCC 9605]|uniref:FkbM family methyltransferase n=1 Tax=Fischerella sp. PCC 9605 TaxID=1173024 RepID=UPI0004BA1BA8|nr:FkbM family methyltransferase [Fischerella sp. PCC 9605]
MIKIPFREYIAHNLIGTPLEEVAKNVAYFTEFRRRIKHPELREIYVEPSRMKIAMARIINDSMNCIDVGAHLGSVLSVIKRLSPHGKHIAIEPIPYKCRWLKQKFPDVEVLQLALSHNVGEADFMIQSRRSGFSGLRIHNSGSSGGYIETMRVNCSRLDDIVPSSQSIGFIKIDVEGGELAVLQGSEALLKRCQPVVILECTKSGLAAYDICSRDVYDFLHTHSYSLFLFKDWLADGEALSYEKFVESMQYPFQAFNFLAVHNG